jgi:hypothetical protein
MIALNPHRQLFANLAYKNASLSAAMTFSSETVSNVFFPLVVVTNVGDEIGVGQTATYVIIACIISTLGAWVASIIVEQAIFLYSKHDLRSSYADHIDHLLRKSHSFNQHTGCLFLARTRPDPTTTCNPPSVSWLPADD